MAATQPDPGQDRPALRDDPSDEGHGMGQRPIARELGLHRHTVRRYVEAETLPERPRHVSRAGMLEPYEGSILELWRQGKRNGLGLWREIVALGYPGTRGNVSRLVAHLRQQERVGVVQLEPPHGLTPRQAVGLLGTSRDADLEAAGGYWATQSAPLRDP